jgi:serine/threonine protein kinase
MKKPMFRRGMPADTARFYSQQILCALRGIHRLGIVYRDLKPENCLIDATGNLALTDFGTAVRCAFFELNGIFLTCSLL